jgi:hypothetical protein
LRRAEAHKDIHGREIAFAFHFVLRRISLPGPIDIAKKE